MFNFLRNRFISIIASSSIGGEEKKLEIVVQQQNNKKQRNNFFSSTTSGVSQDCFSSSSSSSCSCYNHHLNNNNKMTASSTTTIDQNLMNETYFLNKFDEYEKNDSWDKVFSKVNSESDSQAKKLSLCCNLSNNFHEKNRYRNVLPYDQNRIKLQSASSEHEAYINASPLELPFASRNYILTQGPLPNTTGDFWQMIYEQNISICIMLSKVMEKSFVKCHSYFPHKDSPISKFEHFECELEHEEIKPNYIIRRIRLTPLNSFFKRIKNQQNNTYITPNNSPTKSIGSNFNNDEEDLNENLIEETNYILKNKCRIIHHFQFTTWPDFGVPEDTDQFLEFLEEVRTTREMLIETSLKENNNNNLLSLEQEEEDKVEIEEPGGSSCCRHIINPTVVCHCSAGIGRTGTFVIVDSVLSMIEMKRNNKQQQNVEISKDDNTKQRLNSLESLVVFIRKHRMGLIQTPQQLRFCWKTIVDWINKQQKQQQQQLSPSSISRPSNSTTTTLSSPKINLNEVKEDAGLLLLNDNNNDINLTTNSSKINYSSSNDNNNNSKNNENENNNKNGIDSSSSHDINFSSSSSYVTTT